MVTTWPPGTTVTLPLVPSESRGRRVRRHGFLKSRRAADIPRMERAAHVYRAKVGPNVDKQEFRQRLIPDEKKCGAIDIKHERSHHPA